MESRRFSCGRWGLGISRNPTLRVERIWGSAPPARPLVGSPWHPTPPLDPSSYGAISRSLRPPRSRLARWRPSSLPAGRDFCARPATIHKSVSATETRHPPAERFPLPSTTRRRPSLSPGAPVRCTERPRRSIYRGFQACWELWADAITSVRKCQLYRLKDETGWVSLTQAGGLRWCA
jgi:hypothetical protein